MPTGGSAVQREQRAAAARIDTGSAAGARWVVAIPRPRCVALPSRHLRPWATAHFRPHLALDCLIGPSRLPIAGETFAVKIIVKDLATPDAQKELRDEVAILRRLDHPNIVKLEAVFETRRELNLVMELATGGEVFDQIVQRGFYSENDAAQLTMQIAQALECAPAPAHSTRSPLW
jgi:serine/threonine protein kinase